MPVEATNDIESFSNLPKHLLRHLRVCLMSGLPIVVEVIKIDCFLGMLLDEGISRRICYTIKDFVGLLDMGHSFKSELRHALDARADDDKTTRPDAEPYRLPPASW